MHRLAGSECVLLGHLRPTVYRALQQSCKVLFETPCMVYGMTENKTVQCKYRGTVFWHMLCILVVWYHHFIGTYGLHLQLLFLYHILGCKLMIVKGPGNSNQHIWAFNYVCNTCALQSQKSWKCLMYKIPYLNAL